MICSLDCKLPRIKFLDDLQVCQQFLRGEINVSAGFYFHDLQVRTRFQATGSKIILSFTQLLVTRLLEF